MPTTEWLNKYESIKDKLACKTDLDAHFTEKVIGNIPTCDGNKVAVERCSLLRSRMLFLGKNGVLYGGIWGSDGL